ncbi:MAG TPA: ferritin-like domain-containing protein [Trueperaceae bacterium]|nr:ferritin-like domain-containing protein [Trueperaceae bacterium]
MSLTNLEDVLEHDLKDLYSAEKQLVEALPKISTATTSTRLKKAIDKHLEATKEHLKRVEEAGKAAGVTVTGHTCEGMKGLIKEGDGLIKENEKGEALDVALIGAAQRVEHYEIAAYGTAIAHAEELGHKDIVKLFKKTLEEESMANEELTAIAEGGMNERAAA